MTPEDFLREYESRSNSRRFEEVEPLIADNAIYWFNDGSHQGIDAIRRAFERTWALPVQNEEYAIENPRWLIKDEAAAVGVYTFRWGGIVEGRRVLHLGRGTMVLRKLADRWQVIHEHLSAVPP